MAGVSPISLRNAWNKAKVLQCSRRPPLHAQEDLPWSHTPGPLQTMLTPSSQLSCLHLRAHASGLRNQCVSLVISSTSTLHPSEKHSDLNLAQGAGHTVGFHLRVSLASCSRLYEGRTWWVGARLPSSPHCFLRLSRRPHDVLQNICCVNELKILCRGP